MTQAYRSRERQAKLARKAAKQHAYRERQRVRRTPSRDDVARAALHVLFCAASAEDDPRMWKWIDRLLVPVLVAQGFDRTETTRRIEDLMERYHAGWDFRRKPHLGDPEGTA